MIIAAALGLLLLWSLVTFLFLLIGKSPLSSNNRELKVKKQQYERYLVDLKEEQADVRALLEKQQKQFRAAAADFEAKHNTIVDMITLGGIAPKADEVGTTEYALSQVLMAPDTLDRLPRQPRVRLDEGKKLNTDTELDAAMANLEHDQNKILKSGELKMQARIEKDRAILMATGIPLHKILEDSSGGVGGPSDEAQAQLTNTSVSEFLPRLASIRARAKEVDALEKALKSTPLGYPINAESYVTSPFGRRKDPFTGRPAVHTGMDIASYKLAPIVATADGKVSFVGKRNGYGRVVEIDHGHGFKTRYAHLEKTYVKRGQKVEKGEKIAGMGSTGRSTSTHLHYEIFFENRSYDPSKFMKAGHYVQ